MRSEREQRTYPSKRSRAGAKLAAGEFSSRELTQAHLERIDALEPAVGAYLNVDHDGALAAADAVDTARKERHRATRASRSCP